MMRLRLVAVGQLKRGAERDLFDDYVSRFSATGRQVSLEWAGVDEAPESRAPSLSLRKAQEAEAISAKIGNAAAIALDERGKQISSEELADWLRTWRDDGWPEVAFVIGGPDGLDPALIARSERALSLGRMTWPHRLVRVLLAEQLYRAATILAGHPYHRA